MAGALRKHTSMLLTCGRTYANATAVLGAATSSESPKSAAEGQKRHEKGYLNEVRLLGRVGTGPEIRGADGSVCVFSLATKSFWKETAASASERTDWHRIAVFLPNLRNYVSSYVKKGDRVLVLGSIRYQEYTDANKVTRQTTSIVANDVINLTYSQFHEEPSDTTEINH